MLGELFVFLQQADSRMKADKRCPQNQPGPEKLLNQYLYNEKSNRREIKDAFYKFSSSYVNYHIYLSIFHICIRVSCLLLNSTCLKDITFSETLLHTLQNCCYKQKTATVGHNVEKP